MAARPHAVRLAVPRVWRVPFAVGWSALAGASAVLTALLAAPWATGWSITLSGLALLGYLWFALVAGAALLRLSVVRRGLRAQIARLEGEHSDLRRHTAGTAHDMRAPMVTVNSYLELLAAGDFGALPSAARRALEQAARASSRARLIVDATLATSFGVRDGDGATCSTETVDLNAALADVIVSLGADIRRTRADVSVGWLPPVRGSESACFRIFENLVQNALRYAKAGIAPRIEITGSAGRYSVEVAVRDEGRGIAVDEREHVFSDGVRGAGATAGGSGLGLATVQELVLLLGGAVWIDPDVTAGACVRVRLPLASEVPAR